MSKPIINGIDVSECKLYDYGICDSEQVENLNCEQNPDCYFKQLKRLEQREKALTEIADDLQKRNHDLTLTNERLEQENKELKKRQITKNGFICDCEQNAKYKQALEEIREITEVNSLNTCWTILNNCNDCHNNNECGEQSPIAKLKFIKDKINEVLK